MTGLVECAIPNDGVECGNPLRAATRVSSLNAEKRESLRDAVEPASLADGAVWMARGAAAREILGHCVSVTVLLEREVEEPVIQVYDVRKLLMNLERDVQVFLSLEGDVEVFLSLERDVGVFLSLGRDVLVSVYQGRDVEVFVYRAHAVQANEILGHDVEVILSQHHVVKALVPPSQDVEVYVGLVRDEELVRLERVVQVHEYQDRDVAVLWHQN